MIFLIGVLVFSESKYIKKYKKRLSMLNYELKRLSQEVRKTFSQKYKKAMINVFNSWIFSKDK